MQKNTRGSKIGKSSRTQSGSDKVGEKQLSKLRRQELLQILVNQSKEIDSLRNELKRTKQRLEDREIKIASAGNLADASLKIFKILEQTQKAADLYLENYKRMVDAGELTPAGTPQSEASGQEKDINENPSENFVGGQE